MIICMLGYVFSIFDYRVSYLLQSQKINQFNWCFKITFNHSEKMSTHDIEKPSIVRYRPFRKKNYANDGVLELVAFEIFLHCDIIQITKGGSLLTWLITGSIVHTLLKICIYYYLLGTELLYRLCFNNIALVADKCETEIFCMFIRFWSLTITRFKILYLNIHCCIFTQFLQKKPT